ncbi:MAG: phospho-N-acetylmuramoyl-pentapeptide-transferase [Lachnospiraceae bacterium]|jgi:phospho-N-acetylmuramoyl-pentapeptide-transferase|nr:phospho-N-acetylmuramoyl-pentapeptide-transferase [Lachnospiraceae bacterium]
MLIDLHALLPLVIAFAVSAILGPLAIPLLRRVKAGQVVRENGPQSHLGKTGTPTMGGLFFLVSIVATSLFYVRDYPQTIPVLLVMLGFGVIGFVDDYLKVVKKRSLGLRAWQKALGQLAVTVAFVIYLTVFTDTSLAMRIPFAGGYLDAGWFNVVIFLFIVIGTANGANFTDGLDGLLGSVTVLIAGFFAIASVGLMAGITPVACAVAGALLGFLLYNFHPASVFMGDTGSLALGGFVAASAYMMGLPLFIPIVALIYAVEVLSVIIQVAYYKKTGKRVFKMAPIHHHFELSGWKETKVVAVFAAITAVLCVVGLLGIR